MNPQDPNQQPQYSTPTPPPVAPVPAPAAPQVPGQLITRSWPTNDDPGSGFALAGALVGLLVTPLIGLPLLIVSAKKSKAAGYKNTLVTVLIVLEAIFCAVGILALLLLIILAAAGTSSSGY